MVSHFEADDVRTLCPPTQLSDVPLGRSLKEILFSLVKLIVSVSRNEIALEWTEFLVLYLARSIRNLRILEQIILSLARTRRRSAYN